MGDKTVGLADKYKVERTDGKPVGRCFVLDYDKDPLAVAPLALYAALAHQAGYGPLGTELEGIAHAKIDGRFPAESPVPAIEALGIVFTHYMTYIGGEAYAAQAESMIRGLRDALTSDRDEDTQPGAAKLQAALMAFHAAQPDAD